MKKVCCFLLFLFIGITSFAQETEKLPKVPWEELVEINSDEHTPINKWGTDINIGLEGNFTVEDSLSIARTIRTLDSLTETITIKFSKFDTINLRIKFLESFVPNRTDWILFSESNLRTKYKSGIIYIYPPTDRKNIEVENFFESKIARVLLAGEFAYPESDKKRESIFNPNKALNNSNKPLNHSDMIIIKEVYRKGFSERLVKAEIQFKDVYKKLEENRISSRDSSFWWVNNPASVLVLPTIILLLIFVFLINKIYQVLSRKIKKDWLSFGITTFIALLFTDILIVLYVSFNDFLTIPDDYHNVPIIRNDTLLTTALLLVVVIPFIFLFRFIELKISKSSQNNIIKTLLIFVSTWLIPFMVLWLFAFLSNEYSSKDLTNQNYAFLSRAFVILIAIASIRALISFFFFKERNLIIENENKLSALRELKTKAELKSLQSQINPHFLYNALNSIASLAPVDTVKTQKMAYSLSDLFKYTINRKGKKMSTVSDEVIMVENYLEIEKIRFGDRLQFTIDIDKALEKVKIPLFIIQPLVENAVKHGISKIEGEGKIELKINKTAKGILIVVKDNGPNFPEGLVSGHGLQTVFDLLRLTYGDSATLNWQNTPEKSITVNIAQNI